MKKLFVIVGFVLLSIGLTACGGGDPAVTAVTTCKVVNDDQQCEGQSTAFDAAETIYASVDVENLAVGDTVTAHWLNEGEQVMEFTYTLDEAGSGNIAFSLIPEPALPVGDYTVEILYKEAVAQSANFAVSGGPAEAAAVEEPVEEPTEAPTEAPATDVAEEPAAEPTTEAMEEAVAESVIQSVTTCLAVDADYVCEGEPTTTFGPTDTMHASVEVVDAVPGTTLRGRWLQEGEVIDENEFPLDEGGTGFIDFSLVPDGSFPVGAYVVEIYQGETLAETLDLLVADEAEVAAVPADEGAVQSITTCLEVTEDSECTGEPTTTFGPDSPLHASVEVVDAPPGAVFKAVWLQGETVIDETSFPVNEGGSGFIDFNLTPDGSFPPGGYSVEIYQDEAFVDRVGLTVLGEDEVMVNDMKLFVPEIWTEVGVMYPATWSVTETEDAVEFVGGPKKSFYLTGYILEDTPVEQANQAVLDSQVELAADQFKDFDSTEAEAFTVAGLDGLTTDYAYTDEDGDTRYGSVIVATSESGLTFAIYIESLADEYETALDDFNKMLQSLVLQ